MLNAASLPTWTHTRRARMRSLDKQQQLTFLQMYLPVRYGCVARVRCLCPLPSCSGFIDLGAGLSTGITGLAAGYAVGVVGDVGKPSHDHCTALHCTMRGGYCM